MKVNKTRIKSNSKYSSKILSSEKFEKEQLKENISEQKTLSMKEINLQIETNFEHLDLKNSIVLEDLNLDNKKILKDFLEKKSIYEKNEEQQKLLEQMREELKHKKKEFPELFTEEYENNLEKINSVLELKRDVETETDWTRSFYDFFEDNQLDTRYLQKYKQILKNEKELQKKESQISNIEDSEKIDAFLSIFTSRSCADLSEKSQQKKKEKKIKEKYSEKKNSKNGKIFLTGFDEKFSKNMSKISDLSSSNFLLEKLNNPETIDYLKESLDFIIDQPEENKISEKLNLLKDQFKKEKDLKQMKINILQNENDSTLCLQTNSENKQNFTNSNLENKENSSFNENNMFKSLTSLQKNLEDISILDSCEKKSKELIEKPKKEKKNSFSFKNAIFDSYGDYIVPKKIILPKVEILKEDFLIKHLKNKINQIDDKINEFEINDNFSQFEFIKDIKKNFDIKNEEVNKKIAEINELLESVQKNEEYLNNEKNTLLNLTKLKDEFLNKQKKIIEFDKNFSKEMKELEDNLNSEMDNLLSYKYFNDIEWETQSDKISNNFYDIENIIKDFK